MVNTQSSQTVADTRVHILDVARRQFFKSGYAGTSINAIVDATNFTKPTIYYHFKNKEELFSSLVTDAYDRCYQHRRNSIDRHATASEQIYQVVAADFAFCLSSPDLVRFVIALTFNLPSEKPLDLTPIHKRDYESFLSIIQKGIYDSEFISEDPGNAALALQGLIAINIMSYLKMGHAPDFLSPERARLVANTLLQGIARKEEAEKKDIPK